MCYILANFMEEYTIYLYHSFSMRQVEYRALRGNDISAKGQLIVSLS